MSASQRRKGADHERRVARAMQGGETMTTRREAPFMSERERRAVELAEEWLADAETEIDGDIVIRGLLEALAARGAPIESVGP